MVLTKKKWCCGDGYEIFYYCEFCDIPHGSYEQAVECELTHRVKA